MGDDDKAPALSHNRAFIPESDASVSALRRYSFTCGVHNGEMLLRKMFVFLFLPCHTIGRSSRSLMLVFLHYVGILLPVGSTMGKCC